MIVAQDQDARDVALAKLEPLQQEDFEKIFNEVDGKPVIIRYLDPPLHEFLPTGQAKIAEVAQ